MTETVAENYRDRLGRLVLKPSSGGVFDVRVNGQEIHSKKATGQFPEEETIIAVVGDLLPRQV